MAENKPIAEADASSQNQSDQSGGPSGDGTTTVDGVSTSQMSEDSNQESALVSPQEEGVSNTGGPQMSEGLAQVNREFQEKSVVKKASELGIPYVNLSKLPINPDFLKFIDYSDAQNGRVIPFFKLGTKIRVAVENPDSDLAKVVLEKLESKGFVVELNLASSSSIDAGLKIYSSNQQYKKIEVVDEVEENKVESFEKEIEDLNTLPEKISKLTAQEGLNLINIGAIKTNASDIHYEPDENTVSVRFRIDGVLHKAFEIDQNLYKKISNQIKYESKMKLNTSHIPQDGRYGFVVNAKRIGVRVSSIPTPYGESFVCRFLVGSEKKLTLKDLGFQGMALKKLEKACKISHGMVLSTGPTGSGKTTTLYAILNAMKNSENKVITLEDPVEYNINGVTQSQISESSGYTFAGGLRTVLRQDPDIVMLGEIRDLETAETASQASLTGHVLLSTLHTNSAIETIPRLINMGLPPFMVAPALDTIIAQRLVRKVCEHCRTMEPLADCEKKEFQAIMDNLKNVNPSAVVDIPEKIAKAKGCSKCSNTGYSGRLVIAEVVTMNATLRDLVLKEASTVDLIAAARKDGIITMREDGYIKVAQGLTTLEEVYRVTNLSS